MAKMMDETLAASLEALDKGESVDSILSRYPALATALRPFLETAVSLRNQATNPTIAAKAASLTAMKKEAAALHPQKTGFLAQFFHRARRFAPAMAVVALLIVLFMVTIAPPNSLLYGARQVLDEWRGDQQENDGVIEVQVEKTAVSPAPTNTPLPTATLTPTLTVSVTPTMTITETATATPTPTATSTATPVIAPSATVSPPTLTATPLPVPTETAVGDDDAESDESDKSDHPDEPEEPEESEATES